MPKTANVIQALLATGLTVLVMTAPAKADTTLPPRKPGFWMTSMVLHAQKAGKAPDNSDVPVVTAICTDPATDLEVMALMLGDDPDCGPFQAVQDGANYVVTGKCPDPHGGVYDIHSTVSYQGDTSVHIESRTIAAGLQSYAVMDSKWQSECPFGVNPGDAGRMVNGVFKKLTNINGVPKTP
jgi:hypothetical protein